MPVGLYLTYCGVEASFQNATDYTIYVC